MGTCWEGRKLCCDFCSHAGARKVRCPFGYCPSVAACAECRKIHGAKGTGKLARAAHVKMGCDKRHAEYEAREKELEDLFQHGRLVRTAAVTTNVDGFELVKVWFKERVHFAGIGFADVSTEYVMEPATYSALPLLKNATIEDYMAYGLVLPMPGKEA